MTLPLHFSRSGLPIGMMFCAVFGKEAIVLRLAGQLERAMPWAGRHPPHSLWTCPRTAVEWALLFLGRGCPALCFSQPGSTRVRATAAALIVATIRSGAALLDAFELSQQ